MRFHRFAWIFLIACPLWVPPVSATELVNAARNNDPVLVARLIDADADVNERGPQRATPLHWMAFHGNDAMVRGLIEAGARVDATLANGSTPLHLAAYTGHAAVVRVLLASGADPDARNRDGITPLDWARRNRHPAVVALLATDGGQTAGPVNTAAASTPRTDREARAAEPRTSPAGPGRYRVQLVAVSSEARAQKAVAGYRRRFADVLQDASLLIDTVGDPDRSLYRVQSGPLSSGRASAICAELKRRDQACLVRAANRD